MNKIGIIDLGTNTFNLIVANKSTNKLDIIFKKKIPVKLGEGGISKGVISKKAYVRGLDAISKFKKEITKFKLDKVVGVGTSAIRSAANGQEFLNEIFKQFHLEIDIISGDKEAELIYFGVKNAIHLKKQPILIVDIGGGSTEFIIGNDTEIFWKKSYQIGCARLLEKFNPSDPISINEIINIEKFFKTELDNLIVQAQNFEISDLIGCSGSFESLHKMLNYNNIEKNNLNKNTSFFELDISGYNQIQKMIIESKSIDRKKIKGLIPMRSEMIVMSVIIINFILKNIGIQNIKYSKFSLKEGLLDRILKNNYK